MLSNNMFKEKLIQFTQCLSKKWTKPKLSMNKWAKKVKNTFALSLCQLDLPKEVVLVIGHNLLLKESINWEEKYKKYHLSSKNLDYELKLMISMKIQVHILKDKWCYLITTGKKNSWKMVLCKPNKNSGKNLPDQFLNLKVIEQQKRESS